MLLRSTVFYCFMVAWTLFIAIFCSPLLIARNQYLYYSCRTWSKGLIIALRILCNIKYKIIGIDNLPEPPYIVASKHQSVLETILFWQIFLPPLYILKKELTKIPFFGWYLLRLGMIAIDRQGQSIALKQMISKAAKAIEHKATIIIFPEGTRTTAGQQSSRYLPGVTALYSTINVPVVPIALNSGKFWPSKKFTMKSGTVTIKILKPIEPGMEKKAFLTLLLLSIEENSLDLLR